MTTEITETNQAARPGPVTAAAYSRPSSAALIGMVAKREISTKLRDKTYIISVLGFLAIIVAVVVFNIVSTAGSDNYKVGVVGDGNEQLETALQEQAKLADSEIEVVQIASSDAGRQQVKDGDLDGLIDGDTFVTEKSIPTELNQIVQGAHYSVGLIENARASGVDPQVLGQITTVEPLQAQSLAGSDSDLEQGIIAIASVGISYMMLMMIVQFVGQGVVEEKSSRVVELLLTALKPRQLLAGKVLGLGALGFAQLVLVIAVGVIGVTASGVLEIPGSAVGTIVAVFLWFILGYAFFATMAAAAASLVSRQEDLGSALMPMTFIPMLAFFAAFRVLTAPDATLSMILSIVPGFSPTAMPVRAAMTDVPIWQYVVAVVLQVAAIYFLVRLAGRIYSGAMLKTSGKLKASEALKRSRDADLAA